MQKPKPRDENSAYSTKSDNKPMTRRKNRLIEKSVGECSEDKHWDSIRPANMSRNKNEDERIKILSDAARSFMEEKRSMIVR